jgi:hypothetical protein
MRYAQGTHEIGNIGVNVQCGGRRLAAPTLHIRVSVPQYLCVYHTHAGAEADATNATAISLHVMYGRDVIQASSTVSFVSHVGLAKLD